MKLVVGTSHLVSVYQGLVFVNVSNEDPVRCRSSVLMGRAEPERQRYCRRRVLFLACSCCSYCGLQTNMPCRSGEDMVVSQFCICHLSLFRAMKPFMLPD